MKKFFIVTALVLLALACERDEVFTCSLVESEVVEVTETLRLLSRLRTLRLSIVWVLWSLLRTLRSMSSTLYQEERL